ncbi:MAG TPA: hypothetical protein VG942_18735 [Hyphomonadaceae bacterium]|nr:hypothetical protein [Hyphomonadaceae bacterium]
MAARTCAQLLLGGLALGAGGAAARMILAAVCLHIGAQLGSEPTLQEVHALLRALAQPEAWAWATLRQSPMQFVQYVVEELRSGHGETASEAISLAIQAVASPSHT